MTTLYRTYRPSTFEDVVGQDVAVRELRALVASDTFPHAILLVGGRGIGKTTLARIVARELGTAPEDIYELDAASNRGVDDIRELRENVATVPMRSRYKIYILDEVHMLTPQAWNAFLKTLEEPPAHVKFIMATTEIHMVPETITSRSRVIRLRMPTVTDIATYVASIARSESYSLDNDSAEVIAVSANGSFRDALVSLQSVIASGEHDVARISAMLGIPDIEHVRTWLRAIHGRDIATALRVISDVEAQGGEAAIFLELAIARVRVALSKRAQVTTTEMRDNDATLIDSLVTTPPISSRHLQVMVEALRSVRGIPMPYIAIELATYHLCQE